MKLPREASPRVRHRRGKADRKLAVAEDLKEIQRRRAEYVQDNKTLIRGLESNPLRSPRGDRKLPGGPLHPQSTRTSSLFGRCESGGLV
jgi:hypothetical protein